MQIEVHLAATVSAAFDAWVVPGVMQRWLFAGPTLIELTLEVPLHFQGVSRLKVELSATQGGCTPALTQSGAGPPNAEEVWRGMLSGLQRVVLGKALK